MDHKGTFISNKKRPRSPTVESELILLQNLKTLIDASAMEDTKELIENIRGYKMQKCNDYQSGDLSEKPVLKVNEKILSFKNNGVETKIPIRVPSKSVIPLKQDNMSSDIPPLPLYKNDVKSGQTKGLSELPLSVNRKKNDNDSTKTTKNTVDNIINTFSPIELD